jgi:hypothetical protein
MLCIFKDKYATTGYEIKSLTTDYFQGIHMIFNCYDMWSDSYGEHGCGEFSTINIILNFKDYETYNNETLFIEICKQLLIVCENHKAHDTLKKKLGRFSKKPKKYVAYYFAAQIRNEMGKEFLPKPLIWYFTQIS